MTKEIVCPHCQELLECESIRGWNEHNRVWTWIWQCPRFHQFERPTFIRRNIGLIISIVSLGVYEGSHDHDSGHRSS